MIFKKRKLRKQWQISRAPQDKMRFNKAVKELKKMLQEKKSKAIETYLQDLTLTEATDYSLWKATKKVMKHQQAKTPLRLDDSK
ncbi:rna-directed dna polymerase from mobile element jockey-like protein [Lasius niger]|uniref:Rna-directed dna polymerase from mobile element jockey-like protein n=1 Tax=Lasius niger TaxID=67767 RepID=A0A0J7K3T7_LASNI|nr:rna-directed dna polymerase from mobile element jockey-like protein [Lasius niger]